MDEFPELKLIPADERSISGETKFGGKPTIIQFYRIPECCSVPMTLLVQIDGLDFPEADLPDSALVYVYHCRSCLDVYAQMECM